MTCKITSAQYEHLLHKTYGQRYQDMIPFYEGKINAPNSDSTEAFKEANAIARMAIDNNDEDLLFETKVLKMHYYYYREIPLTINILNNLLEEARQKKSVWMEARVEDAFANFYTQRKQYEKAFEHYHRMYNIIKDISVIEFPQKHPSLFNFASVLYTFRDYRSAIFFLKESLCDTILHPDKFYAHCYNSIGLCYRQLNILDSSSLYFRFLLNEAQLKKNEQWIGISSGNLGENYFLQKDYEKAKPLLQKDAEIALIINTEPWLVANAMMILGEISLEQKDIKTAEKQLMQAKEYTYRSGHYKRFARLYPLLAKLNMAKGNTNLATAYYDSAAVVKDSIDREFNSLLLMRAKEKVELEKHRSAMQEINSQKEFKTLQRNALIVIIVLATIVTLFIFDRQRRRFRQKNEQLARAKEELGNFTKSISEKNKLIEDLQQQLGTPDSEIIRQLQESTILTDEQWMNFRSLFDKVHTGYLYRLKEKLPDLTPAEIRFVALSKLRLSTREMASMLGVGPDAIRKYKSRLRKKLELGEEDDLEKLMENI